ncbi:hypothetical protein CLV63_113191 [Murinocardiopsis flavida]|uniref:Uncharacterized protein n=1 Tax=Murinocardiopsis flavida TaxID=645275 RepID=A0A2P8DFN7_9ACTN|nr:hypothetical protein [Murinocardiopsis flavida]PSK96028.1 hypothetical protein CLV63_113191 [Murinocardiopsis flavida]
MNRNTYTSLAVALLPVETAALLTTAWALGGVSATINATAAALGTFGASAGAVATVAASAVTAAVLVALVRWVRRVRAADRHTLTAHSRVSSPT